MKSEAVKAKKRFGQNFLKDREVLHKIIEAIPKSDRKIVEIGPGLGDLTKFLVTVRSVEAFEVDADLCKRLHGEFAKEIATKQFRIHCGDVLEVWKSELIGTPYDLVANLPYYIATNIILKALADPMCSSLLVMVQKEVALKFAADSGEKNFSGLAVLTQSIAEVSIVIDVPPQAFEPPPKVDSAVILIRKHANRTDARFEAMLRVAFTQPRKTLLKNLSAVYERPKLEATFDALHISHTTRPHQLNTDDYHQLYKKL
jgi:16S rRNA (adenine1518-N6/adenine1519-N6)-dimethyltransferase